ncbi:hypothetical protein MINTM019_04740 [Mycobacterium paraintracellulare]|uniref:Uncharacterized protein n=2 Tax=Mycobacterium avium complex (MAC) TaxID=120793 RepID=A0A7R7MP93_MYCIT|nr:hypothetical protein MPRI_22000 [Mycobacterium paraintracellulare]BCO55088.1 hypothetical protein MINTM005_03320 [Mycobacterium intracellulare]BCO60467.1 hypothetical protein MINTM006_04170 [Mycobacterium intracellulare]BCO82159.1 hypothetical protein MINTM011_04940 [Mycobacterium paraintracellulare]BCO87239.1 hypothetical protein MINTM015_04960 [Mycobacterium paraintracellulare]
MPGGSPDPRANTTSTSGHGSAVAEGALATGEPNTAAAANKGSGRRRIDRTANTFRIVITF